MHPIAFGCLAPPGPAGGAYSAPETPSCIKGSLLLRERRKRGREGRGGIGKGRGGMGKGRGFPFMDHS